MKNIFLLLFSIISVNAYSCSCDHIDYQSKEDLKQYDFIALVSVDSTYLSDDSKLDFAYYNVNFTIKELFKGDISINTLDVLGGNVLLSDDFITSCDMYIKKGEKWLLFAYIEQGRLITHVCTDTTEIDDKPYHQKALKKIRRIAK
ncbi:hypothetical protein EI427_25605 (plasmid) [Flammeovirga pectinis]|uniref:Tissue inhibitor of metalloproteinase n=1 Tax=Flammeovirga pectinis TaxID=2494373 RepID=A0A3S9PBN9_9BACT|nr:hypothetical protein [Flammeovirga pectinis]AZQ65614.1 hypothetical protein EI427_25605 [Flammeovirga pectinis]